MLPSFLRDFQPAVLRDSSPMPSALCLRGYHPLWQNFPGSFSFRSETAAGPYNTTSPRGYPTRIQFALFPFRSPLLRESHLISFPTPSKMFQFGVFPLLRKERRTLLAYARKSYSAICG
jgi:hypothetical protein